VTDPVLLPDAAPAAITIEVGSPTPAELAAVTAVVLAAVAETALDLPSPAPTVPSWHRNGTALRAPLVPGPGAWRAFTG